MPTVQVRVQITVQITVTLQITVQITVLTIALVSTTDRTHVEQQLEYVHHQLFSSSYHAVARDPR